MQNIMDESSEIKILSPSAERMHRVFADLKSGRTIKLALKSRGQFVGLPSRRYNSMPDIAGWTDFASESSDVGSPTAIDDKQISVSTDSAQPSIIGPAEIVVADYASPKCQCYNSLVETAVKTPTGVELETEAPSVSSPIGASSSVSTPSSVKPPQRVQPAEATTHAGSSRDFADPRKRRSGSMPNIAVWFCSPDVAPHVPSGVLIATSELGSGHTIAHEQTAVAASSLLDVNQCDGTATEPATEGAKPGKRRSVWKRTKRFFRRLFCCA